MKPNFHVKQPADTDTLTVADLVNPQLKSNFTHYLENLKEYIYASNRLGPLGKVPSPDIPYHARNPWWTFGKMSEKGDTVSELLFPFPSCGSAGVLGDSPDNTIGSFYRSGRQQSDSHPAGLKVGGDNSGRGVEEIMKWCGDRQSLNLVSVEVDDFRERNQPIVGRGLHPEKIKDGLPDSYKFGHDIDPHCCVMNQALAYDYDRLIEIPARRFKQEKASIHQLMNKIKMKNYHNFDDLISAFKEYDQNNCGKISAANIKAMCEKFGIIASLDLVEKLLGECDLLDHDGLISYQEFIHFLNWKDKLPEKYDCNVKAKKYHNEWREGIIPVPENICDNYKTVSGLAFAKTSLSSAHSRTAGIPSIRNHDDTRKVSSLLHSNVFSDHGVYEEDLYALRDKSEIKLIFEKSNMKIDDDMFESLWNQSSKDGKVSVEIFRKTLDEYIWANHKFNPKSRKAWV